MATFKGSMLLIIVFCFFATNNKNNTFTLHINIHIKYAVCCKVCNAAYN